MKKARFWAYFMTGLLVFSTLTNDYIVANAESVDGAEEVVEEASRKIGHRRHEFVYGDVQLVPDAALGAVDDAERDALHAPELVEVVAPRMLWQVLPAD